MGYLITSACLHGQVDGEVVSLDEREEGGFNLATPYQAWYRHHKNSNDDAKHDPRLLQAKPKQGRVVPIAHAIHEIFHEALHAVGLKVPPQGFRMTDMCRQDQGAFDQGKNQGQDDHGRHVAKEIPQLTFDVVKRGERHHRGHDRGKHRR